MSTNRNNRNNLTLLLGTVIFLLLLASSPSASAQVTEDPGEWSRPIEISLGTEGQNVFPTIIADSAGGVHVFWDETIEIGGGLRSWVDYAYWDGVRWSQPTDVFVSDEPWGNTWGAQAVVDSNGVMHTAWIDSFELKYAQRHISTPVSTLSWTNRITLPTLEGGPIGPLAIALDDDGILHVVYLHAGASIPGVYYLRSEDGGREWSAPFFISDLGSDQWALNQERYIVDLLPVNDTLHVVWHQAGFGLVYTQGSDHGQEWSFPQVVPGAGQWPSLITLDENGLLLLTIGEIGGNICLKLQNTSQDGGQTWSTASQTAQPARGCNGLVNPVRDADGGYHLIMIGRTKFIGEEGRIWYASGNGERWEPTRPVFWPVKTYELLAGLDFPSATISHGNLLHAVFHTDSGKIWYTQRELPASETPAQVYPMPTTEPLGTSSPAVNNDSEGILQNNQIENNTSQFEDLNQPNDQPLFTRFGIPSYYSGVIASVVLLGIILVISLKRRKGI